MREFFALSESQTKKLTSDLRDLLSSFSGESRKASEIARFVVEKYSETHRAYHNLSHVDALLSRAEKLRDEFIDFDAVRLAIWFHDVVYEPRGAANERESAALASESLRALNFPEKLIIKVEKMILATEKHDADGLDRDGQIFLDLDLGILGAAAEVYQAYARAIRREYAFVPETFYREKRAEILRGFLRREVIYFSAELRESFEARARENIEREIEELSSAS